MATTLPDESAPARPDEAPPDPLARLRTRALALREDPVPLILAGMITVWSVVFITLCWLRQTRYAVPGFDTAIYDQGIWLMSRFKEPFVTIRGLNLFGHHMNVALLPLVPFYWLGAGVKFLIVVQVLTQASGAIAIYLLARDRFQDRYLGLAMAAVLLLNPTYQFLTWEFFHPDAMAIAPLFFAYWAATRHRWRLYAVSLVLAMACKEDVALFVLMLGLLVALREDRRIGLITSAAAAAWFAIATRVFIPTFNSIGPFYDSFFGKFGKGPFEVAGNVIRHPAAAYEVATEPDRLSYYRMMMVPVAFLPLASLRTLLLAAPMVAVNVLSTFPYQREYRYHWSSLVLAGIMLATVEGVAVIGKTIGVRRFLVGLLCATSLATSVSWGISPISIKYKQGFWPLGADSRREAKREAKALIPPGEATSAIYFMSPQLSHREKIYEFPAPWKPANWGVNGENLHNPSGVKWLILDKTLLNPDDTKLLDGLLAGQFKQRYLRDDMLVAERVRPRRPGEP